MQTRSVEVYRLWAGGNGDTGTWDTAYVEIPRDTPEERIAEVAVAVARELDVLGAIAIGVYAVPPIDGDADRGLNECPKCGSDLIASIEVSTELCSIRITPAGYFEYVGESLHVDEDRIVTNPDGHPLLHCRACDYEWYEHRVVKPPFAPDWIVANE